MQIKTSSSLKRAQELYFLDMMHPPGGRGVKAVWREKKKVQSEIFIKALTYTVRYDTWVSSCEESEPLVYERSGPPLARGRTDLTLLKCSHCAYFIFSRFLTLTMGISVSSGWRLSMLQCESGDGTKPQ